MYSQSATNTSLLNTSDNSGFKVVNNKLQIIWDTDQHMASVTEIVNHYMKGCSCKTRCSTNRCGCKKNGKECYPGCGCVNCKNVDGIDKDIEVVIEDERLNMSDSDMIIEQELEVVDEYDVPDCNDNESDVDEQSYRDEY